MSSFTRAEIHCDEPACTARFESEVSGHTQIIATRKLAQANGWTQRVVPAKRYQRLLDLCPGHRDPEPAS